MGDNQHEKIRELVSKWKEAKDQWYTRDWIFKKILISVDKLLIYEVMQCIRRNKRLREINPQELYNTAIVGLCLAIKGVKDQDPGGRILTRIITYVKKEIDKTFLRKSNKILTSNLDSIKDGLSVQSPEFTNIEFEEMANLVNELIKRGEITKEDYEMVVDHAVNGLSYTEIGKRKNLHYITVSKRIKTVLAKLRKRYE